jgi:hypothetical protein
VLTRRELRAREAAVAGTAVGAAAVEVHVPPIDEGPDIEMPEAEPSADLSAEVDDVEPAADGGAEAPVDAEPETAPEADAEPAPDGEPASEPVTDAEPESERPADAGQDDEDPQRDDRA